jgi:hypothetical protein
MGRHSAPGDEEDVGAPEAAVPVVAAPPRPGRHARPDDAEEPPAPQPGPGRVPRGAQSTAADLALLRERPDVRNRCIAAVVVPFVLYSVALVLLNAVHVYLIWVWIPLVTAGVTAGTILDAAHRRTG